MVRAFFAGWPGCVIGLSAVASAAEPVDFARDIQPLFAQKCLDCHGPDQQESGLRLDVRAEALEEAESGKRPIVPGDPASSELVRRVGASDPDERMPPEGEPLTADEIAKLTAWIAAGARYETHWAYRPLDPGVPPKGSNPGWVRNTIDRYVLARLEAESIEPSPEADRYTLIRRLHTDLVGLPPTIEDVDRFVQDASPSAYEQLVDRLLASPQFGERWGRHWLDKARYADSDGYEKDNPRPDAWRYRNWVIDAINSDLPCDQFIIQQLAGDLVPDATPLQRLATAFNRQTLTNTEGGTDQEEFRVVAVMDRTETLGTVWLGLTVGCARCHSHKYDAITQDEYYKLFAFFNNGDETTTEVAKSEEAVKEYDRVRPGYDAQVAPLKQQFEALQQQLETALREKIAQAANTEVPEKIREVLAQAASDRKEEQRKALADYFVSIDPPYAELARQLDELKKKEPPSPILAARVISQRVENPRTTHVLHRGNFLQPEHEVQPAGLACLPTLRARDAARGADRFDLANWLVDGNNPLPPRVIVNQMWAHLFGEGLVRTMNDFGVRGERPTHPELLDWLAAELLRRDWSSKAILRVIVNSSAYRQSSRHRPELLDRDPTNHLVHRQNRWRIEGEVIRDFALEAGGRLSKKIGGPSVFPPIPPGITDLTYNSSFAWTVSEGQDRYRRGMYTFFKRTAPHPNLTTFDCPDSNVTTVERERSNTPLGALVTLNNEVFAEAAQGLGRRVLQAHCGSDAERLSYAFRLCVARPSEPAEVERLQRLLIASRAWYADQAAAAEKLVGNYGVAGVEPRETAAWIAVVRILLNLDEFITRE